MDGRLLEDFWLGERSKGNSSCRALEMKKVFEAGGTFTCPKKGQSGAENVGLLPGGDCLLALFCCFAPLSQSAQGTSDGSHGE